MDKDTSHTEYKHLKVRQKMLFQKICELGYARCLRQSVLCSCSDTARDVDTFQQLSNRQQGR